MSSDKPDQISQFNLKELREIAASGGAEREQKGAVPKRPNQRKAGSFVDDAESLLSDIRSTVDAEIADEAERFRQQKEEKSHRETAERDALKERRSVEIQAKIEAEARRQRAAADEREHWAHQADIEARRARGEIIEEPQPEIVPTEVDSAVAAPAAPEPERKGTALYVGIVGVLLIGVITVGVLMLQPTEPLKPTVATGPASSSNLTATSPGLPSTPEVPAAVIPQIDAGPVDASVPDAAIADAAMPDATPKAKKKKRRKTKRRRTRNAKKTKKKTDKEKGAKKKFKIQLDGDDGITF
ncbi:MAG: hypothetical protein VX589_19875 [Myxococcota bacterium]|nr:hypothetical protein [Myxococcota bacterium]